MANKKDSLGDRMKSYENITRNYLTRRIPAIIRIDGKAFHTFTKGFDKPFDSILAETMQDTMKRLCEDIQGCILGYTQSDEITLILTDYEKITTEAWFGYNIQKMVSIASSMATLYFNNGMATKLLKLVDDYYNQEYAERDPDTKKRLDFYCKKCNKALFDARVFSIPKDEVCNCLIWRQQDATRNSIEMVGRAHFSHKELYKKTCNDIQEMLWKEKQINWNDIPTMYKRGSCCIKQESKCIRINPNEKHGTVVTRDKWVLDTEIPIFTQDRSYIERLL